MQRLDKEVLELTIYVFMNHTCNNHTAKQQESCPLRVRCVVCVSLFHADNEMTLKRSLCKLGELDTQAFRMNCVMLQVCHMHSLLC